MKTKPETTRRKAIMPTDEEDARINAGIAADPDNPELDDDFWREAKPASEFFGPEEFAKMLTLQRPRGRPAGSVAAVRKVPLTMRVDPDVLQALRDTGAGWQTRVNDALRKAFVRR